MLGQSDDDEFIMPKREEIVVYEDDIPKEDRRSNIKFKYKVGPAVLDNRRLVLDEETQFPEASGSKPDPFTVRAATACSG
jgi:hypothetical protein